MAKQSFSVGQVLTAAQMTSLQETAMGGGAASSKTNNYVLVAADAGTTISMTSTSATTITVNTGLFSAGDTVFIQNLGTGTCTITAGTATVNTAGSLILPQYDAGILYFVSASSAIFYDYIQVGATSPLTTKGDLYTFASSDTRLGVGANNTVLTADSAEATGLKWATPSGSMTLLSTTTLSGASTTISSISGSYKALKVWMKLYDIANNTGHGINLRLNGNTSATYSTRTGNSSNEAYSDTSITVNVNISATTIVGFAELEIPSYALSGIRKTVQIISHTANYFTTGNMEFRDCTGVWSQTDAINELTFFPSSGNFDGGTIEIYGVN